MGDSRRNPRSTQYKGPLPDFQLGTDIIAMLAPNAAFAERLKLALEETERSGLPAAKLDGSADDHDIVIYLRLHYAVPSRFTDKPPTASMPVVELFRKPLAEVQAQVRAAFERQGMQHVMATEALVAAD